ncbi:MAG: hypothetical protein MJ194_07330 [Clostridia bacterium]|nr:hypothetical protein [Clostridia bacterium]
MKHDGQPAIWYIKRGCAFAVGLGADILCERLLLTEIVKIIIACAISVLFVFCFDGYKADRKENILKLVFIISSAEEGYFSLECFFLFLFEMLIKKGEQGGG